MSEAKHTPTPWVADPDWREGYSWNIHIVDAANPEMRICFMTSDGPAQANADLIVEAVNNYESLRLQLANARKALETASELLAPMGDHYLVARVRDQVNAALKEMRS